MDGLGLKKEIHSWTRNRGKTLSSFKDIKHFGELKRCLDSILDKDNLYAKGNSQVLSCLISVAAQLESYHKQPADTGRE